MASVGPTIAGLGVEDSTVGTATWTAPGNIAVSDGFGSVAQAGLTAGATSIHDASVKLVLASVISGSDQSNAQALILNTPTTFSWGSSSTLWGLTPSASDVNNTGFGACVSWIDNLGTQSHYVLGSTFGFAIPAGATINGVVVSIDAEMFHNSKSNVQFVFTQNMTMTITYTPAAVATTDPAMIPRQVEVRSTQSIIMF